jgi:hypothetical protein
MIFKPSLEKWAHTGCSWRRIWLWSALTLLLVTLGCGGVKNSWRPTGPGQDAWVNEDQGDEFNAKHLEELYAKSGINDRDRSIEEELNKWSHRSSFDFPIQINKQVKAYIVYFATKRRGFIKRSLVRSRRYLPMIKRVFREYGLPADLAYLAMVESGFNPKACSPAGACGMWQFIKGTGRRYGLVINRRVDERRNPEKSTRAAARYLLDLYQQFGSWYLAAASYNCGEMRVAKELRKSNYQNFWQLSANKCIPGETRNYVPQMIAATIIARNPKKFGFGGAPYHPPQTPPTSPKIAVAQAASSPAFFNPGKRIDPPKARLARAPRSQTRSAGRSRPKSPMHAQRVHQTRSSPRVASLFGQPHSGFRKPAARKKSLSGKNLRDRKRPKTRKRSPALLARKYPLKPARLAKKPGGRKHKRFKSRRAKVRSKALLVSEAR